MAAPHGRLPSELSSFVGRRRELAEVRRLLGQARLLTLVGVGGVGKSRLALRTARQCERVFAGGVWLVELAPLTEPSLVPVAVARGLGLRDERASDHLRLITDHVGSRRLLLVLDNCEHLLHACAGLLSGLLRGCPELVVLATSREPLGIEGEVVFLVPPLGLPEPGAEAGAPAASEAVALFMERAQASVPDFQLTPANQVDVARLCRYLDGIPLAIEFAAVRLRALSLEQILVRLRGQLDLPSTVEQFRPERQQTLRATMDWSHELLSESERVLWRRLSVFAGGFTLEAAEDVCADGHLERSRVMVALVGLVDRSISARVAAGAEARHRLLEPVRQYGRDRLRDEGEETALLRRHRDWCLAMAHAAAGQWWGPRQRDVLERLETELENVRAGLGHCLQEPAEAAVGLDICASTWFFWNAQRHLGEGRRWLADLLPHVPDPVPIRAASLTALGTLMQFQNDAGAAAPVLEEAIGLCRRLGERHTLVLALGRLGSVTAARGHLAPARALTEEAVSLAREVDSPESLATVLSQAARVALGLGEVERAVAMYRECIDRCREAGERWLRLRAVLPLAVALSDGGRHDEARDLMQSSLALARDLGDERMMAWSVEGLAWSRVATGAAEAAARLLGAAASLRAAEPESVYALDRARTERCRSAALDRLGDAAFERAWEQGARMERAEVLAFALGEPGSASRRWSRTACRTAPSRTASSSRCGRPRTTSATSWSSWACGPARSWRGG